MYRVQHLVVHNPQLDAHVAARPESCHLALVLEPHVVRQRPWQRQRRLLHVAVCRRDPQRDALRREDGRREAKQRQTRMRRRRRQRSTSRQRETREAREREARETMHSLARWRAAADRTRPSPARAILWTVHVLPGVEAPESPPKAPKDMRASNDLNYYTATAPDDRTTNAWPTGGPHATAATNATHEA